ncbi:MAG: hypothetical protein JWR24_4940 [Actinoallomurus sp.]|nr:hypothetical protein [Actinoallomurus sp.]
MVYAAVGVLITPWHRFSYSVGGISPIDPVALP